MSFDTPGSRPESRESGWIRPSPPPLPPAEQLARELIEDDLKAIARRSRSTYPGRLAQLLAWLREKLSPNMRAASAMAEGGASAEPSSDRTRADSRSDDSEEEMNDDAVTLVDVASVTAPASPGKALDAGGDLHPSSPWYSGNLRSPLPLEHHSETTARPAARPDGRREAVAAENPPAAPTSEPDGHPNPPAPLVADRTALTGTVGVGRQAFLPDQSRPRPAARPQTMSSARGRAGR